MEYYAKYRKYYPADSHERVWYRLPMAQGYALIAAGMMNDGWLQFSGVAMADGGYVGEEVKRMIKKKP